MLRLKLQVLLDEKRAFYKAQKAQFQAPINQNFGNMKAQNPV